MKVMALNSSARTGSGQSKTEVMLGAMVKGMRSAGAEVEVVELRRHKVKVCIGCYTCWTKTPGVCVHPDDMTNELFPRWLESDLAVYATPLFHYTVNATMKTFIERTLPFLEPFQIAKEGLITHPLRAQPPRSVVLSVAGFPHQEVFEQLSAYVRFLFRRCLVAEIYRAGAESLINTSSLAAQRDEVLAATEEAGRQIVEQGKVAPETLEAIVRPYAEQADLMAMANIFWRTAIEAGFTPKEFASRGKAPKPRDIEEFMLVCRMGFNANGAGDTRAVIQFDFNGAQEGSCHQIIAGGKLATALGPADKPDLTISAPFEVWTGIMSGELDGAQAFMEGKYQASGDSALLLKYASFFRRSEAPG